MGRTVGFVSLFIIKFGFVGFVSVNNKILIKSIVS